MGSSGLLDSVPYLLIGDAVPLCDAKEFPEAPHLHGLYPSFHKLYTARSKL